jgi:quercetin dioxygenase-like cupin family protein
MSCSGRDRDYLELVFLRALRALPAAETAVLEAHLGECTDCRAQMESLRQIVGTFVSWPTDVLRPSASLWERLMQRIAPEMDQAPHPTPSHEIEPEWEEAAPGLTYKVLAADRGNDRVSLLVRLAPGAAYPPHTHAGVEELYLLDGQLWIEDKKLHPGDYNRAEPGTSDRRVWSETGCTCVLLTSARDVFP